MRQTGNCKVCKGKVILHIGDKIAFCHNKTYFSHSELVLLAESKGLFTSSSEYKDTKYSVINPNGAKKSDYKIATKLKIEVVTPDEFKNLIKKVCPGVFPSISKKPLNSIITNGSRIYTLELSKDQQDLLATKLEKYEAKISKQKRKTLTAVVCSEAHLKSGRSNLFRFWGIPVFSYGRIIKTL